MLALLFSKKGLVFGVTPVALTTKSQPYTLPLVSCAYTGQSEETTLVKYCILLTECGSLKLLHYQTLVHSVHRRQTPISVSPFAKLPSSILLIYVLHITFFSPAQRRPPFGVISLFGHTLIANVGVRKAVRSDGLSFDLMWHQ